MSAASALAAARFERRARQEDLAKVARISRKTVSALETGARRIQPDVARSLAQHLDYAQLYMAVASEATAGVFATQYLDNVNHDPLAVAMKTIEEVRELDIEIEQSLRAMINAQKPGHLTEAIRTRIRSLALTALDVRYVADHLVASLCDTYRFSPKELCQEHKEKLVKRGYLKRRRESK